MELQSIQDRRQHRRVTISAEVTLSSEHNFFAGAAKDISLGGLYVETDDSPPVGAEVTAVVRLPSKNLSLKAEVMWAVTGESKTVGVGLRFMKLPPGAKSEIEDFMQVRPPMTFVVDETDANPPPPLPRPPIPRPGK